MMGRFRYLMIVLFVVVPRRSLSFRNQHYANPDAIIASRNLCARCIKHGQQQQQQQRCNRILGPFRCSLRTQQHRRRSSSSLYNTLLPLIDTDTAATLLSATTEQSTTISSTGSMFALSSSETLAFVQQLNLSIDKDAAESLAGPFFGLSLFPYLAFLYFLDRKENHTPKGVTIGFATCLLFVFLTIPAAIAAKLLYGVSLADSDWLHGSAESLLTITNLVTVLAFRQALNAKEQGMPEPKSSLSYAPMIWLVVGMTALATATVLVPALSHTTTVHTPYLNGFLDLPFTMNDVPILAAKPEPENALTISTWIIHVSSLVEFLVAMGFCWRWADVVSNPKWKGLTWGLIPLHSSGITACTYHLFYNQIPILVPLQALLTCIGNTTAAYAAYRIAVSNGYQLPLKLPNKLMDLPPMEDASIASSEDSNNNNNQQQFPEESSVPLVGFEDLGDALAGDTDYTFLIKLFVGCAIASYVIKYGETFFDFPYDANVYLGLAVIGVPSALNAFKWYKRSQDASFEGWF